MTDPAPAVPADDGGELKFFVPKSCVRVVIGAGGEITQQTGTHVNINEADEQDGKHSEA